MLRGPLTRLANSQHLSLLELLQFRILLEGATSYLAAALRTDEQLTEMQEALQSLTTTVEHDHRAWGKADVAFHDAIARAGGNSLLQVCRDVVRTVTMNMIENTIEAARGGKDLMNEWVLVHTRMFEDIRNGDAELAGRQAHIDLYTGYVGYLAADQRELLTWGFTATCHSDTTGRVGLMAAPSLAVLEGEGMGPEVTRKVLKVLDAGAGRFGFTVATHRLPLGVDHYLSTGEVLPANDVEEMRRYDAILLGAMGDPRVTPGILERGIIVALRTAFRQAVNARPVRTLPGMTSPLRDLKPEACGFVMIRENTEGLYAGKGSTSHAGRADAVAIQTSITTTRATEAAVRYAFGLARTRRKRLTLCHKTNVLLDAGALWSDALTPRAPDFPDVKVDYVHADAMCLHKIASPGRFDVVVTDNLSGDIHSDLGVALQGGLGTAASGNLNFDGSAPSMFEPVHGSAPDIAGTSRANPVAVVLSVAMCLQTLGDIEAAAACERAVAAALLELQSSAEPIRTEWVGDRIADRISKADTRAASS